MKTARRVAAATAVAAVAGLATMVLAAATGDWPVFLGTAAVALAVIEGPVLLAGAAAFVADWKEASAQTDEDRRLHQMEAAIEQERGQELGIKPRMAELRTYYAGLDGGVEGGAGRFRERVSAEPEPGWDRGN